MDLSIPNRDPDPLRNISVFRETCTTCGAEVREVADEDAPEAVIECMNCGSLVPAKNRVRWH
jgi:DNA-directed RNA polymerase subunit RPC12/RpoP